jgi:hypothetical protein
MAHAQLPAGQLPIADLLAQLDASESPGELARRYQLTRGDLLFTLALPVLGLNATPLSLVQDTPRFPRRLHALEASAWKSLAPGASLPELQSLSAGLLLIHDHWDASHTAAQQADDMGEHRFAPYWHGIAHRREPDAGNASYWFCRVGKHPLFETLARAAAELPTIQALPRWSARLLGSSGHDWNPSAHIDLATTARPGSPEAQLAIELQRLELALLLEATASILK